MLRRQVQFRSLQRIEKFPWGMPVARHSRKRVSCLGGIAQLGERLHGMQEVSGSIPLTSTND